ncbi:hypothetical protein [Flagellimonas pacifica]|uniref:Uncharacterized protein n=1 Tax=Flagellimonas pacifica TaxID=1247520 RepID=A0A285MW59_9FLAO|nr:hypothetical protein [Allomuricauda parva]SNZ01440.1 hypothetical protein SAMN06265377_3279 [Allomuricauda parva]
MHTQGKTNTIKRTKGVPRPTFQGRTTVPIQKRDAKTQTAPSKGLSLSDVTIAPMLAHPVLGEKKLDLRELAQLMVEATRYFSGNIDHWRFLPSDSYDDLILRCANRLRDRGGIDHMDILQADGYLRLVAKRYIGNRGTVHCIPLRPILPLRWKNPALFHILFSFVKELPYIGMFQTTESRIDWIWEFLFEEETYHKKQGKAFSKDHSVKFFSRYESLFDGYAIRDWKTLLERYSPRKPLHRKIKRLLLKANTIDFQKPFCLSVRDAHQSMFEHWESFLIVDDPDSEFTRAYIEMLNECSNEYDITSAFQHTVVEQGNIQPFREGVSYQLNRLEEFLSELNELLRQL